MGSPVQSLRRVWWLQNKKPDPNGDRIGVKQGEGSMTELVTRWRNRAEEVVSFNADAAKAFRIAADQLEAELNVLPAPSATKTTAAEVSWRERIWTVHPETRMTLSEVLEALNVGRTWFYREAKTLTRRTDGSGPKAPLWFLAGEVREWWTAREKVVVPTAQHAAELN